MATQAQICANRMNSKLSTGPRTQSGKDRSCLNALQHGMYTTRPLLTGECPVQWKHFEIEYVVSLSPSGEAQMSTAKQAAATAWKMRRIPRLETLVVMDGEELLSGLQSSAETSAPHRVEWPVESDEESVASGAANSGEGSVASGAANSGEGSVASGEPGFDKADAALADAPNRGESRTLNDMTISTMLEWMAFIDSPRLKSIMRYEAHLNRVLSNQLKHLSALRRNEAELLTKARNELLASPPPEWSGEARRAAGLDTEEESPKEFDELERYMDLMSRQRLAEAQAAEAAKAEADAKAAAKVEASAQAKVTAEAQAAAETQAATAAKVPVISAEELVRVREEEAAGTDPGKAERVKFWHNIAQKMKR